MKFHIKNVRMGLATNSSSSHSIVFFNGNIPHNYIPNDEHYGWEDFTLSTSRAKADYLAVILRDSLRNLVGPELTKIIVEAILGPVDNLDGKGIDHQSSFPIPTAWDGRGIDMEFFSDLRRLILKDGVVILGGNDNSEGHPLSDKAEALIEPRSWYRYTVARKDEKYGFWTMFSRENGAKLRFWMSGDDTEIKKSSVPELVDIKITDFCTYNCKFCYQDSTEKGKHASTDTLGMIAHALGNGKVFEVALGGGEPTLHPHFLSILKLFRLAHIVPNFTTRRIDWLKWPGDAWDILKEAGSVGVSVTDNIGLIDKLAAYCETFDYDRDRFVLHYVMGVRPLKDFSAFMKKAKEHHFQTLLLGYKTHGRGKGQAVHDYSGWVAELAALQKEGLGGIGIDTALAAQSGAGLTKAKIPSWMYSVQEGDFSMYIDAVERTAAPSSYCDKSEVVNLVTDTEKWGTGEALLAEIKKVFAGFRPIPDSPPHPGRKGKRIVEI